MKIDPRITADVSSKTHAAPARRDTTPTPAAGNDSVTSAGPARRRDSVELSSQGKARAESPSLSPERIDQVRQQIASGTYNSAASAEAVARKIVSSGDL